MIPQKKSRFLNTSAEAVRRQRNRISVRQKRKREKNAQLKKRRDVRTGDRRVGKPCCGKIACACKPPVGRKEQEFKRLVAHSKQSTLVSFSDTTDVEVFERLSRNLVAKVPLSVLFGLSFLHALFNQEQVWESFMRDRVVSYKQPFSPNFAKMMVNLRMWRKKGVATRSSNYYSVTLSMFSEDGGYKWSKAPTDTVMRDVLMARLVWISIPVSLWKMFADKPCRATWTAIHVTFQENLSQRARGICDDYMHKCALDRLFAVARSRIPMGTVSWWPVKCPAYLNAYKMLWHNLPHNDRFAALMYIYKRLKTVRNKCLITDALAQTCWLMKSDAGQTPG